MAITPTFVIIVFLALILGKLFLMTKKQQKIAEGKGQPINFFTAIKIGMTQFFTAEYRNPKEIKTSSPKSLGGQPILYNEVDYTKGRFLGFHREPEDLADERVIRDNYYRIRYLVDVRYFWVFKASKEEMTPCRFRPNIDIMFKGPGEEIGIPPEGLAVILKSMDGTRVYQGPGLRWHHQILEQKHVNNVLIDMLTNLRDKERFTAFGDTSKDYTDIMENKLKRTKKLHDVSQGRNTGLEGFGNPYAQEMYGQEEPTLPAGGSEGLWNFQG